MPQFTVKTSSQEYVALVERGCLQRAAEWLPPKHSQLFVVTTRDVWDLHGALLDAALGEKRHQVLFFPGGEHNKRLSAVESLCEQMVEAGGDRASAVIAFGGGIVGDVGGFAAASFMRGIPVVQAPTTLLAQVDAATGGKTGVNLTNGKNLLGAFHQPLAVLVDPSLLSTLPQREYVAGLYEVIKYGIIRTPWLFELLESRRDAVLARDPDAVDALIAESVRIKAEVVSADEKEGGLRRILNYGHTLGHALEAETGYKQLLHGEAVGFGMIAAAFLAKRMGMLAEADCRRIVDTTHTYGPIPSLAGVEPPALLARLVSDKKTVHGNVHFVLPSRIGEVEVRGDVPLDAVRWATEQALQAVS
ncbi:MAG: 3-dehydroquinate synthase [Bryobacterales bacterium]|nr:3-dehydroquinate synthase [Bryobacterales bacterium]